ncbi:MAG: hypothetical protein HY079_09165 [Elusimicrobia bacterium]|nr:hypothetical protein [Elusimicrobiota bacterium]
MTTSLSLLIAAAALAAPAPKPGPVGVSTATATAEARLSSRCSADGALDVAALLADPVSRRDLETISSEEARKLVDLASCRELQGVGGGCAPLSGLKGPFVGGPLDAAGACRALAGHARFVVLVVKGGAAEAGCRQMFEADGARGPAVERGCSAFLAASRAGRPLEACATLKKEGLMRPADDCEANLASWSGDGSACARIGDAEARRDCRERAALVTGLRDPARCHDSPACLTLSQKSPKACEAPSRAFGKSLCARLSKTTAESRRLLDQEREFRREEARRRAAESKREADAKSSHEALVKAKADAEAKRRAEAEAKKAKQPVKLQFSKGQPMSSSGGDVKEVMRRLEKGLPVEKPKPETPGPETPPADGR